METKKLLTRFLGVLNEANAPLIEYLQNGIDRKTINEYIKGINLKLPDEVYELYELHNGIELSGGRKYGQLWFFMTGAFVPIEISITHYHNIAVKEEHWKEKMFMLFESGGGEMYLIDCDESSPTYRMIFEHWVGAVDYDVIITAYDSLDSMLTTLIECFETNAYYYDDEGYFQFDFNRCLMISKQHNPKSKVWDIYTL
jgi:hypothetical protein